MTAYIIINTNRGCLHTIKRKTKRSEQIRQGLERAASNDCPFEIIFKKLCQAFLKKVVEAKNVRMVLTNTVCCHIINFVRENTQYCVRLAQLDRAFGYGPKGREFESSNARYSKRPETMVDNGFRFFC